MLRFVFLLLTLLAACQPATPPPPLPTLASIQILDFWEPVTGTLASAEDVEEWRFVAQAGDNISLRMLGEATGVTLTLQTADGLILTQGNSLEFSLPLAGTYTVLVQGAAGGYELGLGYTDRPNPNDPATPTPLPEVVGILTPTPPYAGLGTFVSTLAAGQMLSATLNDTDERHVYTFDGMAGEYVTLLMGRVNGTVDPILTLYDPDGNAMATDDNSGGSRSAAVRNILLPEGGKYSVVAEGDGFPGSYSISLSVGEVVVPVTPTIKYDTPTPYAETLTPVVPTAVAGNRLEEHMPVGQGILQPGDFDRFPIFAAAGEFLTIGASPLGQSSFEPYIEIFGPTGELVASASARDGIAGRDALIPMMPVLLTGVYVVFVKGVDDVSTGDYSVSYGIGPSRENTLRGLSEADTVHNGEVLRRGLRDVWSLYLNAGDIITATVSPLTDTLDPLLELVAPDGSLVATDDNSGGGRNPLINSAYAPVSGIYRLRVTPVYAASSGPYTLVWRYVNVAPTPTAVPATIPILDFDDFVPDSTYLFYPFQGRAGQQVVIRVNAQAGSTLDPVAALLGPDGAVIAEGDDYEGGLNPRFVAALPVDGTYTVRVNGYLSGGPFQVLVDLIVTP